MWLCFRKVILLEKGCKDYVTPLWVKDSNFQVMVMVIDTHLQRNKKR